MKKIKVEQRDFAETTMEIQEMICEDLTVKCIPKIEKILLKTLLQMPGGLACFYLLKNVQYVWFRVKSNENLFGKEVLQQIEKDDPVIPSNNFCQCTSNRNELTGTLDCPEYEDSLLVQAKAFSGEGWIHNTPVLKTKRAVAKENDIPTDEDDVEDDYEFVYDINANPPIPQWPTQSGITKEVAVQTCTDVLLSSPVAKSCIADGRIEEITRETIDSCVEDIKVHHTATIYHAVKTGHFLADR